MYLGVVCVDVPRREHQRQVTFVEAMGLPSKR